MQFNDEDRNVPPGSQLEQFFRRFGMPGMPRTATAAQPRDRGFSTAQGSGFFISADGYAVTNNHVVERGKTVEVQTDDNKTYTAKVIGTDPKTDLALLKVDGRTDFPFVKLGDKQPRIGDWVIAVGNPFGLGGTVTAGIVSARGRDIGAGPYDDFIQIDAPVNKGNSGGPTFDVDGNVIGVNTAIFSPNGGSIGIGFAIPAETVKTVVAQLKEHGAVTRGWIGVQIQPVTADVADSLGLKNAEGALVAEAQANSPAAKAGIASGDVITSVNGEADQGCARPRQEDRRARARRDRQARRGEQGQGEDRGGDARRLSEGPAGARVGSTDTRAAGSAEPQLGLTLAPADNVAGAAARASSSPTSIPTVRPPSAASRPATSSSKSPARRSSTPADVRKALADARADGKRTVLMRVKSGEATRFVALPLGRA